jgi:HAD superfamily hydrolase (TIGR01662 family)
MTADHRRPLTTIVIPTVGRPSLRRLLTALHAEPHAVDCPIVVVDDRPDPRGRTRRLPDLLDEGPGSGVEVLRSGGVGPAAARNLGWRRARTPWVSFVDDDVVPSATWYRDLLSDLRGAGTTVAGIQGRISVPLPEHRRPTDWERGTAGLSSARWITADMSYRRAVLQAVGGFDERFPRAYREDADLALRVLESGHGLARGRREVDHPVRPSSPWASVRQQAGNGDDVLMRRLHGRRWRDRAEAPPGRFLRHVAVVACGVVAAGASLTGHRRTAATGAALWSAGTAELAWARIAPGPRTAAEVATMVVTSVAIPPAAVAHRLHGTWRHRHAHRWRGAPDLVLFDRDGTLVHDVPYNADPDRVAPVDGARDSLNRLRAAGVRVGIVTNQSGVATGTISSAQLAAVHARVEALLGPFDIIRHCPHAPADGCACRKPAPGMVVDACTTLGVEPDRCVVVGDIASDLEAARAAGASSILVPAPTTREQEIRSAGRVAPSLGLAVEALLEGAW